ncbi:MAG: hypothetical protein ACE5F1_01785 [Planctomycetota bacterium]
MGSNSDIANSDYPRYVDGEDPQYLTDPVEGDGSELGLAESASMPDYGPGMTARASILPLILGISLIAAGILLGVLWPLKVENVLLELLSNLGLSPALVFVAGVLLTALSSSPVAKHRSTTENLLITLEDDLNRVQQQLHQLTTDEPNESVQEHSIAIQNLLVSFQKHEGLLTNLNKATRMFNKPLVDIVGLVTDLEKGQEDIRNHLESLEKATKENIVSAEKKWEGLAERIRREDQEGGVDPRQLLDAVGPELEELLLSTTSRLETKLGEVCGRLEASIGEQHHLTEKLHGLDLSPALQAAAVPSLPASAEPQVEAQAAPKHPKPARSADETAPVGPTKRVFSAIERLKQLRGG